VSSGHFVSVDSEVAWSQVQERLTKQVACGVVEACQPRGVGVVMTCKHMCMAMRGVCQHGATTTTTSLQGCFADDPQVRAVVQAVVRAFAHRTLARDSYFFRPSLSNAFRRSAQSFLPSHRQRRSNVEASTRQQRRGCCRFNQTRLRRLSTCHDMHKKQHRERVGASK